MSNRRPIRTDIHPSDVHNRLAFRDQLRQLITEDGRSEQKLSRAAGCKSGWVRSILTCSSWRVATIQRLSHVLGLAFELELDDAGLQLPPPDPSLALLGHVDATSRPLWREGVQRVVWADTARRVREACYVSVTQMASALKVRPEMLREWESGEAADPYLWTFQRYYRMLGRPVRLRLRRENGQLLPPVGQWVLTPPTAPQAVEAVQVLHHPFGVYIWNTQRPEEFVSFTDTAWQTWLTEYLERLS